MSVSLFLYDSFQNFNEGQLTALKGKIIGNRNLYYCGVSKNIPGKLKVEDFTPKSNFITPAYTADRLVQNILIENEVNISHASNYCKTRKCKMGHNNYLYLKFICYFEIC